ncbi:uncharacterized protein LOC110835554 isoform X2 [Zootermopsis nevadensis]|uniref:uncharacterized protein LOC110835554 isoform X2 n=1 Tax=Zootermopsis nevadensis TaxID=136037 RepID=UPI000B8E9444|nr:uncharacterized protein LOC110835554 isoform X2 [Zootermopsis nevadensis]
MKRRQTETKQTKRKCMEPDINCFLCARVGNEVDFIPIFSTKGKTEQLYQKIMIYTPFKRNTKHRIADVSCNNASFESASREGRQKPCIIKDELIVPDKTVTTTSDCQNVECFSNAEIFIRKRSKSSALSVAKTCLNNSNKSSFIKKSSNASSPVDHICNESKGSGRTYCIARWCGNNAKKSPGISLFRIPKDPNRALLWLTNAEREDLKMLSTDVLHTKYLCMEHFNDDMFMNSSKKKLVWNALPTCFPKPNYAHTKESKTNSQHQQKKSKTARKIISEVHQPTRRRPLKPKPATVELSAEAGLKSHPGICNAEEIKSLSGADSSANSSPRIKKEDSPLTEIQTCPLKTMRNDTNPLPKCQITSQLSLQASRMLDVPNTNKFTTKLQETAAHSRTSNIILCNNSNETVDIKQDKIQNVTNTCEYLSLGNTDSVHHKDYHSDSSTVGDNKRNENYTSISDESYLNCDVESLCLEHAFRETNERIYPCRYCGEMFLVKSNLILHQTTYHSDHPVGCELCGKVLYKSRSEFMEHVCDHHGDSLQK